MIDDRDVSDLEPSDRGIAMVFQSDALYPDLTAGEIIAFGLSLAKMPEAEIARIVEATAATLQLTPYLDRKPNALLGGKRQRVAIGRSIVRNPKFFFLTNPCPTLTPPGVAKCGSRSPTCMPNLASR